MATGGERRMPSSVRKQISDPSEKSEQRAPGDRVLGCGGFGERTMRKKPQSLCWWRGSSGGGSAIEGQSDESRVLDSEF